MMRKKAIQSIPQHMVNESQSMTFHFIHIHEGMIGKHHNDNGGKKRELKLPVMSSHEMKNQQSQHKAQLKPMSCCAVLTIITSIKT